MMKDAVVFSTSDEYSTRSPSRHFFFDEYDFRAKGMSEIVQASSGIIYAPLKSSNVRVLSFTAYDVFQILFSCDLGVKSLSKSKTIRFSSRIAHFCGIFFSDFHIVKS